ncbi:hypothetical protein [Paenirhodobacter sp.]|uniref:hypothetical protein n=1 Tax=Paenirhodobacter sp. TaxID=1965326 RepID=UPI003B3D24FC
MIRVAVLALLLAGCTQPVHPPGVGVHAGPGGVTSSVSSGVGPVSMGVNSRGGGYLGTRLGPVSLGAGF